MKFWVLTFAAAILAMPIMTWAQPTGNGRATEPYAILLDNEEVLWGTATRVGDTVEIRTDRDSVMRLPYKRIAHVGRSLPELYAAQLKQLPTNQSRPAMQLAQWCLQHELTSEAAELLIRASQLPHDANRLESLQRRLQQEIIRKRFPPMEEVESSTDTVPLANTSASPVHLSPEAMLEFVTKIQPLVLNRCGNAGCHGRASSCELQLQQPSNRSLLTKEVTQTNAAAIARYVNYLAPIQSELLQRSAKAHGGANHAPLTLEQQNRLVTWVEQITGRSSKQQPETVAALAQSTVPTMLDSPQQHQESPTMPPAHNVNANSPVASVTSDQAASTSFLDSMGGKKTKDDPFDPSPYNQTYALPRQSD